MMSSSATSRPLIAVSRSRPRASTVCRIEAPLAANASLTRAPWLASAMTMSLPVPARRLRELSLSVASRCCISLVAVANRLRASVVWLARTSRRVAVRASSSSVTALPLTLSVSWMRLLVSAICSLMEPPRSLIRVASCTPLSLNRATTASPRMAISLVSFSPVLASASLTSVALSAMASATVRPVSVMVRVTSRAPPDKPSGRTEPVRSSEAVMSWVRASSCSVTFCVVASSRAAISADCSLSVVAILPLACSRRSVISKERWSRADVTLSLAFDSRSLTSLEVIWRRSTRSDPREPISSTMRSPARPSAWVISSLLLPSAPVTRSPALLTASAIERLAFSRSRARFSWAPLIDTLTRSELLVMASRWVTSSSISTRRRTSLSE